MNKKMNFVDRVYFVILQFLVWGSTLLFLSWNSYFTGFFGKFSLTFTNYFLDGIFVYSTQGILFELLCLYSFVMLVVPFRMNLKDIRVYNIFFGFLKLVRWIFKGDFSVKVHLNQKEKLSLLVYLVKFCFLPLLVHFTFHNINNLMYMFTRFSGDWTNFFEPSVFLFFTFPLLFYLFLTIDTFYFVFGYLVESKTLGNEIKSVDTTFLGWFFALACYPPYNALTSHFLGWYSSDFGTADTLMFNYVLSIFAILFFLIYVIATINLGKRASNMTNRGIVSWGAYKYVRHPAYISKNLAWWVMGIPFIIKFGWIAVFSLLGWTFVYYMRAITEERHLSLDKDYLEYRKKVKYKFIPYVW